MTEQYLFYKSQYDFYKVAYWNISHNSTSIPNGFIEYPEKIYNYFHQLLDDIVKINHCNILDMCCGNGLLLKHLMSKCNFDITPYGIDFQENSIIQAQNEIHKEYKENFINKNAIDFEFTLCKFDIILVDPYHFHQDDLQKLIDNILANFNLHILFYSYADVLNIFDYNSVSDFAILKSMELHVYNYPEISIAVYTKGLFHIKS
jgi:2-polyprenyl-3-methyl-5-hydroxy-6-metoxy-1,4-benzoquinol methylase